MKKTPVIPTAYTIPSYSTLVTEVSTALDTEMQAAGFAWSSSVRYSFPWVLARVIALVLGGVYRLGRYIASGILPSTARDLEQLKLFGDERGVTYLSGTLATGLATIIGETGGGNTVPAGSYITDTITGLSYVTTAPVVVPDGGSADVAISAVQIGSEYLAVAHPGRLEDPPAGIATDLLFTANTAGTDDEDIDEYRTRILSAIADPPEGGARADWIAWANEILSLNVDNVWIYSPGDVCPAALDPSGYVPMATVGVLFSLDGTGAAKIPSGANVTAMTNFLLAHAERPITSIPEAFAVTDNNVAMTLSCHLTSGAVAGAEVTAAEAAIRAALQDMLDDKLGQRLTPGANSGDVVMNSWIHSAISTVGGLDYFRVTALDGGSGDANVATTNSWELTRFTVTFGWV
jgi:uncharacterized phage protein gp47/JayE